jgi:hypothetical protein
MQISSRDNSHENFISICRSFEEVFYMKLTLLYFWCHVQMQQYCDKAH